MNKKTFLNEMQGNRLDLFLTEKELGLTRSQIQRLIRNGSILVNERVATPGRRLKPGEVVSVTVVPDTKATLEPQPIPLTVVYQDKDLIVLDKPSGLTVHPGPGHPSNTLVNALLALRLDLSSVGGRLRPGIVHRLDKDTSGLMVVAKNDGAHVEMARQWKSREVRKGYLALVRGEVKVLEGIIETPIGRNPRDRKKMAVIVNGKSAITKYKVSQRFKDYTLLQVFPRTGRTHQVRVHFANLGHPLIGDRLYGGGSELLSRQFLHANFIGLSLPSTGKWMEFTSHLPRDLQIVMDGLGVV